MELSSLVQPLQQGNPADDVTAFVKKKAKTEVCKEISKYEMVTGAKINYNKSVGLQFGAWRGVFLGPSFGWMGLSRYLVSGLVLTASWKRIDWKSRIRLRLWFICGPRGDFPYRGW